MQKLKNSTSHLLKIILISLVAFSSCVPNHPSPESVEEDQKTDWGYQDLRVLDDVDMADPASDIIAVYCRQKSAQIEIRIDFLDLEVSTPDEFFIAFDYARGGSKLFPENIASDIAWDLLFSSKTKKLELSDQTEAPFTEGVEPSISIDDHLDAVLITFPENWLENKALSHLKIQVLNKETNSEAPSWDRTNSFSFYGDPPKRQAPLLLTFWNSFNVYTPAQALRSWNGAHTGPIGQRHGLFHLLSAVEKYQVPVALVAIKNPHSLAALSYMHQLDWIITLEQKGLLILPDSAYGDPDASLISLNYSRQNSGGYGFPDTPFAFGAFKNLSFPEEYSTTFAFFSDTNHIYSNSGKKIIPLPTPFYLSSENLSKELQYKILDEKGLTLQAKTQLVKSALSTDSAQLNVFGGDLKTGLWADQYLSDEVFEYIARHPWIRPLSEEDLLTWKAQKIGDFHSDTCSDILCTPPTLDIRPIFHPEDFDSFTYSLVDLKNAVRESLQSLGDNPITDSAWTMYLMLTTPSFSTDLQSLQANYLGTVGHLIEASRWYEGTPSISTNTRCEDIDWDGEDECIMYNHLAFTTFEQEGGLMAFAFVRTPEGVSQLFGPSSQFIIGTGDPQDWKLDDGLGADPLYSPGAFFGEKDKLRRFTVDEKPDGLVFTMQGSQKTYRLQEDSLSLQFNLDEPETISLTLLNNPQFSEGYSIQSNVKLVISGPEYCEFVVKPDHPDSVKVSLKDCIALTSFGYTDSLQYLDLPEDPNQIYPDGHFLPFPISILEIQSGKTLEINIGL